MRHEVSLERTLVLGHPRREGPETGHVRLPAERNAPQIILHLENVQYAIIAHFEVSSQTWNYIYGRKPLCGLISACPPVHETSNTNNCGKGHAGRRAVRACAWGLAGCMSDLTHVELLWLERHIEHWIRFRRPAAEQILDRRRRVLSFTPGSILCLRPLGGQRLRHHRFPHRHPARRTGRCAVRDGSLRASQRRHPPADRPLGKGSTGAANDRYGRRSRR